MRHFNGGSHSIVRVAECFFPTILPPAPALYHIKHLNQCRTHFKSPLEVKYYLCSPLFPPAHRSWLAVVVHPRAPALGPATAQAGQSQFPHPPQLKTEIIIKKIIKIKLKRG